MKKMFRLVTMIVLFLAAGVLRASDLPGYAPKNTNLILFANLNRIANSRFVQKILAENPDLRQKREDLAAEIRKGSGLEWDEMLNSELCFFANFKDLEKPAFQLLAVSNSGKAAVFFDHCARSICPADPAVGEVNGVRIVRDPSMALLLLDSRMLQFSYCGNDPAGVIAAPLVKTDLALAGDVDTGALLSLAVDVANADLPGDVCNDGDFRAFSRGLVKVTINFSEKGDTLTLKNIATYCDESSAFAALEAMKKITEAMKNAVPETPVENLLVRLAANDTAGQNGCRVIGTSEIDTAQLLRLLAAVAESGNQAE